MQVSERGDLANWSIPGELVKGMGGAMDLVARAGRVLVLTSHIAKSGESKLVGSCALPLTGAGVVDRVITDRGVFDIANGGFVLVELAPRVSVEEVRRITAGRLDVSRELATTGVSA